LELPIIDLPASSQKRGVLLGSTRADCIWRWLRDWLISIERAGVGDVDGYLDRFLADTNFVPAIQEHAPDILDEVHQMAAAAEIPKKLLLAGQLMDEEWVYRRRILGSEEPDKCSSFAIRGTSGRTWVGQNMDLDVSTDGHQAILRIEGSDLNPGAIVFTIGGMVGLMGVNRIGLGVCVNSLPDLPSAGTGLPVAFVLRELLRSRDIQSAVHFLRKVPHATSQHYLLATAEMIRSFEASSAGVLEYESERANCVLHTNHPLANWDGEYIEGTPSQNSLRRLACLQSRLSTAEPNLGILKAALRSGDDPDHPVCKIGHRPRAGKSSDFIGFTTGSMISAITAGSRGSTSWVSAGPPALRAFRKITFPVSAHI
jgi:hypothetical protein